MRHGTAGIALSDAGKRFPGGIEPERMEQGHRPIERGLHRGRAGRREVDLAELCVGEKRRAVDRESEHHQDGEDNRTGREFHGDLRQ